MNQFITILSFKNPLIRALKLVWESGKSLSIIVILLQFVQAFLPVAQLYVTKILVEELVAGNGLDKILLLIVVFVVLQLANSMVAQFATYIQQIQQNKLTDYMMESVLTKAINVDYAYYENPKYHDTLHLAQQQSLYKTPMLLSSFTSLIQSGFTLILLLSFFLGLHTGFSIAFILLCIPLAVIKWYFGILLHQQEKRFAPLERESSYLYQSLTGLSYAKEVRIFGFGNSFIKRFHRIRHQILKEKQSTQLKFTWYSLVAEAFEVVLMGVLFYFLAKQTWAKLITVGLFVIYLQGFQRLQSTTKQFLQAVIQVFQLRVFMKDLFGFFDIPSEIALVNHEQFPLTAALNIENISFTYPQTDRPILKDVSISCKPGEIIAIVGENGSGKSTLVKLLAGLYHVSVGKINFNNVPLKEINKSSFRKHSIFLFQDFEKYFFSVEENIALASADEPLNEDAIKKAATYSGADSFIQHLSRGYKTRMGRLFEGSEQLSGGQWQKLALSRMFYKNAQLVVLDEPTSSLDPNAELELFRNIQLHLKDKMVVIISHRLYNLKIADTIYVMQDGQIVEKGGFHELVEKRGLFHKMYEAQSL